MADDCHPTLETSQSFETTVDDTRSLYMAPVPPCENLLHQRLHRLRTKAESALTDAGSKLPDTVGSEFDGIICNSALQGAW